MTASRPPRAWTHGDLVVLRTLATAGEPIGSLASRLRRPQREIELKCAQLALPLEIADLTGDTL